MFSFPFLHARFSHGLATASTTATHPLQRSFTVSSAAVLAGQILAVEIAGYSMITQGRQRRPRRLLTRGSSGAALALVLLRSRIPRVPLEAFFPRFCSLRPCGLQRTCSGTPDSSHTPGRKMSRASHGDVSVFSVAVLCSCRGFIRPERGTLCLRMCTRAARRCKEVSCVFCGACFSSVGIECLGRF